MKFVDLETARSARGLRLIVLAGVPSPWSEAAKGIFRIKGIDFVAVRMQSADDAVQRWTGSRNAPVAIYDDEPPRTGWAEILALAERLDQRVRLLPVDVETRAHVHGFSHEILGENGLLWCARLVTIDASLTSEGARAFPLRSARYLASRYGYAPERISAAQERMFEALGALDRLLAQGHCAGGPYYFGEQLSALDVYSAVAMGILAPLPEELCPMHPAARAGFSWLYDQIRDRLPAGLLEHRDLIYARHLGLPVEL
jgi:glutathione S-transferase